MIAKKINLLKWEKIRDGVYTSGPFDLFKMDKEEILDGRTYEVWNIFYKSEFKRNASSLEQAKNACELANSFPKHSALI